MSSNNDIFLFFKAALRFDEHIPNMGWEEWGCQRAYEKIISVHEEGYYALGSKLTMNRETRAGIQEPSPRPATTYRAAGVGLEKERA